MSNIKVSYKEIIAFLEANKNKKVSTIMPQVMEMVTSKTMAKTFRLNDEGNITHIFCYYHKEWECLQDIEYGNKASSSTGFNTMCKEGVSQWSKQQRKSKASLASLLDQLASQEIAIDDLQSHKDAIEEARTAIIPHSSTTLSLEECSAINSLDEDTTND